MKILLAILLPSVAVLLCGRVMLAIVLFIAHLTVIGWLPAAIVAVCVVMNDEADKRADRTAQAIREARS